MPAWAEERVCFMREGWYQIYDCLGRQVRLVVTLSTDNAQLGLTFLKLSVPIFTK